MYNLLKEGNINIHGKLYNGIEKYDKKIRVLKIKLNI